MNGNGQISREYQIMALIDQGFLKLFVLNLPLKYFLSNYLTKIYKVPVLDKRMSVIHSTLGTYYPWSEFFSR